MRSILLVGALLFGAVCDVFGAVHPKWISGDTASPTSAAPYLVRTFSLANRPQRATFEVAVAGWHELYVNGKRIGKDVLSPVTCQPDRRISSVTHDVTDVLKAGENELKVLLGNGSWNCFTTDLWGYDHAPWLSAPQIRGEFVADGKTLFVTDGKWRVWDSPIVFNALRNGEYYDARLEGTKRNERAAKLVRYSPWGVISPEDSIPCREHELYAPTNSFPADGGGTIYDFGVCIAGWCEIEVLGARGAKVTIDYDELVVEGNKFYGTVGNCNRVAGDKRPFQHDEYTLAGRATPEKWHPRFTYHGLRYARVRTEGQVELRSIRARFVHSDLKTVGSIRTSDATFTRIQEMCLRSVRSNFMGFPTDCPGREKMGWTGDPGFASDTVMFNFDATAGYRHFVQMMIDSQRPNGALPCINPCTPKFGFTDCTGPTYEATLFVMARNVYLYTGDDSLARTAYPAMKRYLKFIAQHEDNENGLIQYGLYDWTPPEDRFPSVYDTDTAACYELNRQAAFWGDRFGDREGAEEFRRHAAELKAAHNRAYRLGNGAWGSDTLTSLALPLYFEGLCVEEERQARLEKLVETLRARNHGAWFGGYGGKWVPRVLAENGYIDDAWTLVTQKEFPGWGFWAANGATTIHERCVKDGRDGSLNHVMFADPSAWAYKYIAGIRIVKPGFAEVLLKPGFPKALNDFAATRQIAGKGELVSSWCRKGDAVEYVCKVPEGVKATVELPGHGRIPVSGRRKFTVKGTDK